MLGFYYFRGVISENEHLRNSNEGGEAMESHKPIKSIIGSVFVIVSIIFIGCTVKVPLKNYEPVLPGDYSVYEGKRVYLMTFDNQARDTSVWYYYSPYIRTFYFGNDSIRNYFWYAFRDSFKKAGMFVSDEDNPDLAAPAMGMTLLSISDENYDVRVTVEKKGITIFTKAYTILEPRLGEKDRNPAVLEQRAYKMTNRLIEAVLGDSGFQKVLTEP
jgi:hypothetical protein